MTHRLSIPAIISLLLIFVSCSGQETAEKHSEVTTEKQTTPVQKKDKPHRYGGWYCPDNFGFTPVDINKLNEVPAIADRLPTQQELDDNMSLIKVDTVKYPDARALKMDLPKIAHIYSESNGMSELIIVIQAIIVMEDTVVGYRFANGGNGSAWLSDVNFLSEDEVAAMGAQPFFYSKSVLKTSTANIWKAIGKTAYFKQLGEKFGEQKFFSSPWDPEAKAYLNLNTNGEKASGYVGMVYGNYYLHIDYNRNGFHYSEKLLMVENHEDNTTEFFFASGPYPEGFEKHKSILNSWIETVKRTSQAN